MVKRSLPALVIVPPLLWALYPHNPYSYYTALRILCCGVFAYLSSRAYSERINTWPWIFGITALVYNPFFTVHLTRDIWSVINLMTVALAFSAIWLFLGEKAKMGKTSRPTAIPESPKLPTDNKGGPPDEEKLTQEDADFIIEFVRSNPELVKDFVNDIRVRQWEELDAIVMAAKPTFEAIRQPLPPRPFVHHKREPFSGEAFLACGPEEQLALLKEAREVLSKQKPIDPDLLETFKCVVNFVSLPQPLKESLLQI